MLPQGAPGPTAVPTAARPAVTASTCVVTVGVQGQRLVPGRGVRPRGQRTSGRGFIGSQRLLLGGGGFALCGPGPSVGTAGFAFGICKEIQPSAEPPSPSLRVFTRARGLAGRVAPRAPAWYPRPFPTPPQTPSPHPGFRGRLATAPATPVPQQRPPIPMLASALWFALANGALKQQ